ncbi:hypothetical protein XmelCFBP4644_02745 [Xanthomonas melonis]|uniref:Uncharacterized protein n=2 Tax=Xanthomonas melonis TaxID=56456 RepID=A0A2S7DM23_9XANT|nr:hypothetical protein [Xanthomonas melonis]MCC4598940.1 hypothetical protein [Xanthomonas melonis]PPU74842.1 hypothetical protein XmelCFBP4644_02745 [Xanthomonas melonis]
MSSSNDPQPRVRQSHLAFLQSSSVGPSALLHRRPCRLPVAAAVMLSLGVAASVLPATALAGAWTQPQGDTLLIVKALHSDGTGWFDDAHHRGDFANNGRSRQDQLNVYLEHGLTDRLSLIGNFYFTEVGFSNDSSRNGVPLRQRTTTTGFADQEIGLRYALSGAADDAWRSAVQALVSIPAYGRSKTYHPNNPGSDPALGLGDYGLELRYSRGRGYTLGGRNGYVDLSGGVRLRGSAASDEVRLDASAGLSLTPQWLLLGEANVIQGLGNGRNNVAVPGQSGGAGFVATGTNYDLTKLQLSALYTAPGGSQWQLGYQQPVMGRNTGAAGGPFVAAWWRF